MKVQISLEGVILEVESNTRLFLEDGLESAAWPATIEFNNGLVRDVKAVVNPDYVIVIEDSGEMFWIER